MQYANTLNSMAPEIYRYLNFDQLDNFVKAANQVKIPAVNVSVAG
jgi:aconitate hydratase 2/2-methylisocitrate dehydratase